MIGRLVSGSASDPASVTATQLVRDFPGVRRLIERGPLEVTSHGRTEAIVLSPEYFDMLVSSQGGDSERLEWKLSLTLDAIETHVLILDEHLTIRRANRYLATARDMKPEDMVGRHISSLAANPTDQFIIQRLSEVLRTGQPEVVVVPSSRRPGRMLRHNLRLWPKGVALFADDITEREHARDGLAANDAVDHALGALGNIGLAHAESNGQIISASIGLARLTGVSPDALFGARLQNLFDPRSRAIVHDALAETPSEGRCYEVHYLRDGTTAAPGVVSIRPYWTAEHHACVALVLLDRAGE